MDSENLIDFLAGVELFSKFSPQELAELAVSAEHLNFDFGEGILKAGEPGRGVFIIVKGTVRLFTDQQGKETSLGVRKTGDVFSELAALREHRLEYSVRASAKTTLLHITREALAPLLERNPAAADFIARFAAIRTAGGFVSRLFDLRGKVAPGELEDLIQSIGVKPVKAGHTILSQGGRDDRRLYIVRQGKVQLVYREDDAEYPLATLQQGESFGEKACLLQQEQPASAVADGDVVLLVIPEQTIRLILERNPAVAGVLEARIQSFERELQRQKKLAERRNRRILLDLFSKPRLGERIIRRFPLVEQAEEMDCGAACLAMICRHFHINLTLGKLRELANVTTEGATLDSLARVGESLGFATRGVQCTFQALLGFELPFIAHWEGYHYIVVYGISKHHVWLADPALGFRKLTVEEFERGWSGTCLLFTPGESLVQLAAGRSPWLRFIGYLRPFRKLLGHLFIATLVIEVLSLAPPLIIQNILDRVVVHQSVELLHVLIAGLIIAQVFTQLTVLMRALLSNYLMRNLDFSMIAGFFRHTLALPVAFFAKRRTGDIFARFQENHTIRRFMTESTISTLLNLMMVFIYLGVLFVYNVQMTLLLLALVIPIALLTFLVTPRLKHYARRAFEASTDAESLLMETLSGAETVKGMGIERAMRLKWERKYAKSLDVQYRAGRFQAQVQLVGQLLSAATTVVVLWVGATLVLEQQLSIGQLIAFNMLMGSVMAPLLGLVSLWHELQDAAIAIERLGDVLDLEPEQKPDSLPSRILLPDLQGDIRLENVYFRYGGNETSYVLENISCEIKSGQLVAIVGQSGSGKTTLAKLLVGFYPPSEGRVFVDGYDLNLVDLQYYRAQVGYVMQSNLVFSGTVAENIAIGDENPDRRRIIEVAKMADAHGYIGKLPLGYEQVVGERGVGLSGGQIQRLCIARALYHNPRVLIFDEATSALDTQSESNILGNMHEILKGRTAIVIAHRLSTVMNADKILVLYDGCITEQGGHQELLDQQGMYYQLVQKQLAGAAVVAE